jgi:hypothetical protein
LNGRAAAISGIAPPYVESGRLDAIARRAGKSAGDGGR